MCVPVHHDRGDDVLRFIIIPILLLGAAVARADQRFSASLTWVDPPLTGHLAGGASLIWDGQVLSYGVTFPTDQLLYSALLVKGFEPAITLPVTSTSYAMNGPGPTDGSPMDPGATLFWGTTPLSDAQLDTLLSGRATLSITLRSGATFQGLIVPIPEPAALATSTLAATALVMRRHDNRDRRTTSVS
jgi:hypothetical protein